MVAVAVLNPSGRGPSRAAAAVFASVAMFKIPLSRGGPHGVIATMFRA